MYLAQFYSVLFCHLPEYSVKMQKRSRIQFGFTHLASLNKPSSLSGIWPGSAILTIGYDVPYNACYILRLRSSAKSSSLQNGLIACFTLMLQPLLATLNKHKFDGYMVHRIFWLKRHRQAGATDASPLASRKSSFCSPLYRLVSLCSIGMRAHETLEKRQGHGQSGEGW